MAKTLALQSGDIIPTVGLGIWKYRSQTLLGSFGKLSRLAIATSTPPVTTVMNVKLVRAFAMPSMLGFVVAEIYGLRRSCGTPTTLSSTSVLLDQGRRFNDPGDFAEDAFNTFLPIYE